MKAGDLEAAKSFALKLWEMEKQFMRIAPSSKDRYLVRELVRLEDKPVEHRTEGEQWEIERINEQLAERPPYRKQARPVGPIQPLRTPRSLEERQLQMEPHIRASQKSLNYLLNEVWGLEKLPQPVTFQVVDGYTPMVARAAAELAAKEEARKNQGRVNPFVRFGRWVKGLFARKQPPTLVELTAEHRELAAALKKAEEQE